MWAFPLIEAGVLSANTAQALATGPVRRTPLEYPLLSLTRKNKKQLYQKSKFIKLRKFEFNA